MPCARHKKLVLSVSLMASLALLGSSAYAFEFVHDGQPAAAIIVPAQPLPVESYAAKELQYHIQISTGAQLPIVPESQDLPTNAHIFLGHCHATADANINPVNLPGNSYVVKTAGNNLFIAGSDSRGDPLDGDTHEGTLFAVYDLLENQMQVRWLWPGKLGEVIPRQKNLSVTPVDSTVKPLLWFKTWRGGSTPDERVWLKRQRFGRSVRPQYGHSFGKYWEQYGQTHPEYFNMLPDGTRRLDPNADSMDYMHMCASSPGLVKQIVADWRERGAPEFLNVCEDDGWAGCACPTCLSWDEPDSDNPIPFGQRLAAARRAFNGQEGRRDSWMLLLGSLSDRYAKFWKNVTDEAAKTRPDVKVVSYVYDNYRKPPVKATLDSNVLCGLVPQESIFGYSKFDSEIFRKDWSGWEKTGCQLFLRPNYTLQAQNFPANYARTLGEDLKFAMAHGLRSTDFDSLTSKYSTQGPSLYMLAKILNHPDTSPDAVIEEFCAAFGPAQTSVKKYFDLWESIYPHYTAAEETDKIKAKRKYGAGLYGPYYLLATELYPPQTMTNAWSLLDQARQQAASDPLAAERVEWLKKGLQHTELLLATQRAYEHGIDSGDKTEFRAAYQSLLNFRAENAAYDQQNSAGLTGNEKVWAKAVR